MATKSSCVQIYRAESRKVKDVINAARPLYYDAIWAELKVGRLHTGSEFVFLDVGDQYLIVNSSKRQPFAGRTVKCRHVQVLHEYPCELLETRLNLGNTVVTSGGIEICWGTGADMRDFVLVAFACRTRFLLMRKREDRVSCKAEVPIYDAELEQLMATLDSEVSAAGTKKSNPI